MKSSDQLDVFKKRIVLGHCVDMLIKDGGIFIREDYKHFKSFHCIFWARVLMQSLVRVCVDSSIC